MLVMSKRPHVGLRNCISMCIQTIQVTVISDTLSPNLSIALEEKVSFTVLAFVTEFVVSNTNRALVLCDKVLLQRVGYLLIVMYILLSFRLVADDVGQDIMKKAGNQKVQDVQQIKTLG